MYKDIEIEADKWEEIRELVEQLNEEQLNEMMDELENAEEFRIFTPNDNDELPF